MRNCYFKIFESETPSGLMVQYPDCSVTKLITKEFCDNNRDLCYYFDNTEKLKNTDL